MTLDDSGNVYIAGTSLSSNGFSRLITIKYNAQGNQVWTALYGTNVSSQYPFNLQVDSDGKVVVTGNSLNGAFVIKYGYNGDQLSEVFSTNIVSRAHRFSRQPSGAFSLAGLNASGGKLLVENYDANGNLLSSNGSYLPFYANLLKIDSSNHITLAPASSDPVSASVLAKYDATGSLLWKTNYNGLLDANCQFGNFTTDTNGNIFVTGYSSDINYQNGETIFIKFDPQGNRSWVYNLGKVAGDTPKEIQVDEFGNPFVVQDDFTVMKFNSAGTRLWESRPAPVTGHSYSDAITTLDRSGNLYISGRLNKNGVHGLRYPVTDRVTVKFDGEGHELWAKRYTVSDNWFNRAEVVMADDSNNVFVTGFSSDSNYGYTNLNSKFVTTKYGQANLAGAPVITHDPESLRATAFTTVSFTVSATGDGPLTYQWNYNNLPIPGMTNATLILTNVAENADGVYSVAITNSLGWIRSREAFLTLDRPPIIDGLSESVWLASGESATVGVLCHGNPTLSFQWQHNGTNLPGATNAESYPPFYTVSSLVFSNVSLADQGDYRVIISNDLGMVTSAVSRINITRQIQSKWTTSFPGSTSVSDPYNFSSQLTATDTDGNIYVSGKVADGSNNDYLTVKLDSFGNELWSRRYEGTGRDDIPSSMVLDHLGNVYVTGISQNTNFVYEFATIKYNTDGNLIWVVRDPTTNGFGGLAYQIAVDDASNVYVAGLSYGEYYSSSCVTTKYGSSGEQLWQAYAQPIGFDVANALALDRNGDVLIGGGGGIIKYSSSGTELWRSAPNSAYMLKTDTSNNVYVLTAMSEPVTQSSYTVEKYDSMGNHLWSSGYGNSGGSFHIPNAFSVTPDGSVYVAGTTSTTFNQTGSDYLTVKFDTDGRLLWSARFSEGFGWICDQHGLAIDDFGNAYVTGVATGNASYITTVKYDPNGNQLWSTRHTPQGEAIAGLEIIVANQTNIFVTAVTKGSGMAYEYAVIAYEQNNTSNQPMILIPPQGQMVFVNSNVVLNITGSADSLQYQWRHFGENIPGATNATLVIPNFQPQDGGDYSVIVDNGFDKTVSPQARLTPYIQLFSPSLPSSNQFSFTLVGEKSRGYEIESSSDLLTWDSVTNLFNTNGIMNFTVPSATNNSKAFYRAKKSYY